MTDMPKAGFLCAGKTPIELSVSIHCASKLMKILREYGFLTGGCYTEILDQSSAEKIARAGKTLEHLCMSNELVISVGCDGFSAGDAIPDITDVICPKKATYFANILCGSQKVCLPDDISPLPHQSPVSSAALRLFPDDAGQAGNFKSSRPTAAANGGAVPAQGTLAKKLENVIKKLCSESGSIQQSNISKSSPNTDKTSRLTYGNIMKIFSLSQRKQNVSDKKHIHTGTANDSLTLQIPAHAQEKKTCSDFSVSSSLHLSHSSAEASARREFAVPLSRASAGIIRKSLLLNFSNDVSSASILLRCIMHAVNFSVYNLSGKSAFASMEFENSLNFSADLKNTSQKKHAINS